MGEQIKSRGARPDSTIEAPLSAEEILESAPVPIGVHCDGVIVYANRALFEVLAVPLTQRQAIIGRNVFDVEAPEDHAKVLEIRDRVLRSDRPFYNVTQTLRDYHGRRWLSLVSARAVRWRGRPAMLVAANLIRPLGDGERVEFGVTVGDLSLLEEKARQPPRLGALTRREREVAELLTKGLTPTNIAMSLEISESTVRTHLRSVYRKVGVHSRVELVRLLGGLEGDR